MGTEQIFDLVETEVGRDVVHHRRRKSLLDLMMPLALALAALAVEGQLHLDFGLTVLGDGQKGIAAVEGFQRVEDCIFLNFAALDLALSPPSFPFPAD